MRESQGKTEIFLFKAICLKGPKAKDMKVRPAHTQQSNKQDQNSVKVGSNPGKSVCTTWPVFPPSFCNCIFHATGYKLIDFVCQKLLFSGFLVIICLPE